MIMLLQYSIGTCEVSRTLKLTIALRDQESLCGNWTVDYNLLDALVVR